ncbi:hypothetical protein ABPG77_011106 [Micractinium sp. CCAP 211/92]
MPVSTKPPKVSPPLATVWELHLHTVAGLPLQGTAVAIEAQLGDVTWRSAPAASHGGVAYFGAWVAVQPTTAEVMFRVTDRGVAQCSGSGTVNAAALARAGAAAGGAAGDATAVAQGAEGAGQQQAAIKLATQAARDEEQLAAENQAIQPQQQPALPLPAGLQEPPAMSAEEVTAGLHLEVPVDPLPQHLHAYGHGAFMGAALSMGLNLQWRQILQREDPEAYKRASKVVAGLKLLHMGGLERGLTKTALALMPCLENNPVLAAYGAVRSGATQQIAGAAGDKSASVNGTAEAVSGTATAEEAAADVAAAQAVEAAAAADPEAGAAALGVGEGAAEPLGAGAAPGTAACASAPPALQQMDPAAAHDSQGHASPAAVQAGAGPPQRGADRAAAEAMLAEYLQSQRQPNKYGYLPIAQEWDIWVHPSSPADLAAAGVSHGSAAALVTQAVTTAMPCTRGCARSAGQSQITGQSLSPVSWLAAFGHAVNAGVNGDRAAPLPLAAEPQRCWRLRVAVRGAVGVPADRWFRPYVKSRVESRAVLLPKEKTGRGEAATADAFTWARSRAFKRSSLGGSSSGGAGAELAFWPLPEGLDSEETLALELRGDPAGIVADSQVGRAALPLGPLAARYPCLLAGEAVRLRVTLTSPQAQRTGSLAPRSGREIQAAATESGEEEDSSRAGQAGIASLAAVLCAQAADGSELPAGGSAAGTAGMAGGPALDVELRLEPVSSLDALVAVGLPPAAAQTCLAMLAEPGGLYLDIKSAYSTPQDLMMFVSMLKGLGIHTKAVCSFQPRQLKVPRTICRNVLFFHGLGGLEAACDAGLVPAGQFVLFNGASFLADLSPGGLQLPEDLAAQLLTASRQYPVDAMAVRRYKGLVEQYGFAGGIYVQEPDTAASAAQALISLVAREERYFPLGFAYGHLRDAAVSVFDLAGRGFASQEILEELAARNAMSSKVVASVQRGQHRGISTNVTITWARRLVTTDKLMSLREQRALLALLGQLPPGQTLLEVLDDLGGIRSICLRFFQHYEAYTPMTLLEAGFNVNHQKAFLRLLRNHGALAALPLHRKVALARFFLSGQLWGYGLTWLLMFARLRTGLHKHGKEGLLCLLESCTGDEYDKVLLAVGGRLRVARVLRGRLRLSWHYLRRMQDVERTHETLGSHVLAYENTELKYAALQGKGGTALQHSLPHPPLQARSDPGGCSCLGQSHACQPPSRHPACRRALRKSGCCALSCANCTGLNILTIGFFTPCCVCPRVLGATFKGTCSMGSVLAFILGLLAAIALYIFLAAVLPDAVS